MVEIYNTLTGQKERFTTREEGKAAIYVCGPTTYNFIHLGNARPLVFFDTVRRYLEYRGYKITYVQNFTDVDDKIINRAREEGEDPLALARKYVEEYFQDADALNVRRADVHPRVSEHIGEIVAMVEQLTRSGHAYAVEGDVYFNVRSFHGYGKLSGRTFEDMQAGARVEVDPRKQDPMDFALWKAAKAGEPAWDSPWGPGRPGWHIECSAMSQKYLGVNFDIHGGGYDLVFPHHENEIAQSEAANGQPFVRYWMHNGFITVNQEKMSKSLGNFFLVRDLLAKFPADLVRFYLLSTHYRSPLDFDDEKLVATGRGLARVKTCLRLLQEAIDTGGESGTPDPALMTVLEKAHNELIGAMDDDFNTALAIGALFDLTREVNSYLNQRETGAASQAALLQAMDLFQVFNTVLGIFKLDGTGQFLLESTDASDGGLVNGLIELIISIRQNARGRKDWAVADSIRDGLKELGIVLEDTPRGVRWKKQD